MLWRRVRQDTFASGRNRLLGILFSLSAEKDEEANE